MAGKPTYRQLEERIDELERSVVDSKRKEKELRDRLKGRGFNTVETNKVRISNIDIEWKVRNGSCTFEELPVVMMWVDSTLAGLMSGVQAMVGTKRFNLALQSEGRKSVEADWAVMSKYSSFEKGFRAIANIAAVAGWGNWKLLSLDKEKKQCCFRVANSWEGRYQKGLGVCWGSGMLAGKLAGYCSKLFEDNFWTEQTSFIARGDRFDEFRVEPSERSIESEIENLLAADEATSADMSVALQRLNIEISERVGAEEKLRESEERFRNLLEFIPGISIQGYTTDGIVRYWNKASEKVYGYSSEEAVGKDLRELIIPDDIKPHFSRALKYGKKAKRSGELMPPGEIHLRHKNGSLVPVYSIHTVVCLEGVPPMLFCIDVDLSERKKAEMVLKQSEERLRSIVEHTNNIFYVHSIDHEFTYVSPTSMEILGYTPKEMMRKWTELITDNPINKKGLEVTEKAIKTGRRQRPYLLEIRKKDGQPVMLEINESPIKDSRGTVLGLTGAVRDVTDRIKAKQALQNAHDELEQRVSERTKELSVTNNKLLQEVRERKEAEEALREKENELMRQTRRLEEMNTALNVLLEHRDKEKTELKENILLNVEKLAMPYLDKLDGHIPDGYAKTYLDIIRANLKDLVSPFAGTLSSKQLKLTPTEMQVVDFIRNGFTNKEIASQFNISIDAVSFHRKNIRKKLELTNKKTNLRSYLLQFSDR